mgnify:FL=1
MRKIFTLLTLAILWATDGAANIYVAGDFNDWDAASGSSEMQYFSDHAEKKFYFEAGKTYKFKIVDNGNWLGDKFGGTMRRGASTGWDFFKDGGQDTWFDTDIAGEYTFIYYWGDEGKGIVSLIYPARTQDITLTTVNTGYYAASYCPADYNVTVPEGVTVWRIGSTPTAEGNYTAYNVSKEHTGETVVLGNETGVLLISEEGDSFTFTETSETATELGDNNLRGAYEEVTSAGDYLAFFVATGTQKNYVAFAKVASGVTIPKGKAYMDAPTASSEVRIMFDGMTTGISSVEGAAHSTMHNLLGMPVNAGYRGIVIRDGKKFVNK